MPATECLDHCGDLSGKVNALENTEIMDRKLEIV